MLEICSPTLKWEYLSRRAFRNIGSLLDDEHISKIHFKFRRSSSHTVSWSIIIDDKKTDMGELVIDRHDTTSHIRNWLERLLISNTFTGRYNTEICNVECETKSYTLAFIHHAWDTRNRDNIQPICAFMIIEKDIVEPIICCLCERFPTIKDFYLSLLCSLPAKSSEKLQSHRIEKAISRCQ